MIVFEMSGWLIFELVLATVAVSSFAALIYYTIKWIGKS